MLVSELYCGKSHPLPRTELSAILTDNSLIRNPKSLISKMILQLVEAVAFPARFPLMA